jgi:hypothetical protein
VPPPPVCGAAVGYDGEWDAPGGAYVNGADGAGLEPGAAEVGLVEPGALDERGEAWAVDDAPEDDEALAPPRAPDAVADGVKIAGCVDDGEVVQAATVTATQTVKVAAPTAVVAVLAAVPAGVARTFMKPPTE